MEKRNLRKEKDGRASSMFLDSLFIFSIVFFYLKDLAGRGETGVQSIRSPALVPDALRLNTEHLTINLNSILSKSKSYISTRSLP